MQGLSDSAVGVVVMAMAVVLVFVCVLGEWAYQDGEGRRPAFSMGEASVEKRGP